MRRFFGTKRKESVYIEGEEYNHLRNVLRLNVGDELLVSLNDEYEYACQIQKFEKNSAVCKIRGKEKWKEVIEAQKQSGLTIKKYCNDNHICISSFYKQKALILEEENTFLPVIIDKSMMLLILILTIIIFPVPNKISRFY